LDFAFDNLPDARRGLDADRPVFVFGHLLAPHPPFVYCADGSPALQDGRFGFEDGGQWQVSHDADQAAYRAAYAAQFTHVMDRLARTVDGILAASPRPPVIIIQGDHGPGSGLDWTDASASDHEERFGIFNAWLLPPQVEADLPDDLAAVNTFVTLFNALFGSGLEPRPDGCWFATFNHPYAFIEVLAP
jgi:hypothetical protein